MTDRECAILASAVGEAARAELPPGGFVFVTIFDDHEAAAAYGTGEFERTRSVLEDMLTATRVDP